MKHGKRPSVLSQLIVALLAFATVRMSEAATIVTTPAGGDWSDPATWTGGTVPTSVDRVEFANASPVTVSVTTPQQAGAIYGSTTAAATTNNYILNVSSSIPRSLCGGICDSRE